MTEEPPPSKPRFILNIQIYKKQEMVTKAMAQITHALTHTEHLVLLMYKIGQGGGGGQWRVLVPKCPTR